MGFANTTTSRSTFTNIDHHAVIIPPRDGALLTSPFRPPKGPAPPLATAPTASSTVDYKGLIACLWKQLFPHIEVLVTSFGNVGLHPVTFGKQVLSILVNHDELRDEFSRRGDGTISHELEAKLARQAAILVHGLVERSASQTHTGRTERPPARPAPKPVSKSILPPQGSPPPQIPNLVPSQQGKRGRVETPIPIPYYHGYIPSPTPAAPAAPAAPPPIRPVSSSPIPPPVIPTYPPPGNRGPPNLAQNVPPGAGGSASPRQVSEVIVIDDDDEPPVKVVKLEHTISTVEPPRFVNSAGPDEPVKAIEPPKPVQTSQPARGPRPSEPTVPRHSEPVGTRPPETTVPRPSEPTVALSPCGNFPRDSEPAPGMVSRWFTQRHPYVSAARRAAVVAGTRAPQLLGSELANPTVFHVDFTDSEVSTLRTLVRKILSLSVTKGSKDPRRDLARVVKKNHAYVAKIVDVVEKEGRLPRRTKEDVHNFLQDLVHDHKTRYTPSILTLEVDGDDQRGNLIRSSRVSSLLFAREICGHRGVGSMRCLGQFTNEFRKCREDGLEKRAEWTGCAGDISTVAWVSNSAFICGTTEHSDSHNQQYNKPGNLVLGSCDDMALRAYPEHRIVRPFVEKGENSTEEMRQSQDPWLYSSVVSSDYDAVHDRAFTSSFDRTVKIWKVEQSGASMALLGEWKHGGNVNFVAASKHGLGLVATASDVAVDAIRIYSVYETDIANSPYRSYSCSRVTDEKGNTVSTEKWAYFPATMQWGLADPVKHLLLVGYSPRSRTGDDSDIPEDRRDSGELCLWDGITGERWRVTSATTQNVFEVLWHPTQEVFIAATSPLGLDLEPSVRTQIRIFTPADKNIHGVKAFSPIMTLDCTALDVNELTIMPNSVRSCYVTAGCTDGNTYVWDTGRGERAIHVLRHGEPIDEYRGDREREDVGVKFTAWGSAPDRFYTGASDGVLKVWNVRSAGKPLVRKLLEAPAPITAGMFCPDKSRLVVGDASGRVYLLSIDEEKELPLSVMRVPLPDGGGFKTIRRPRAIIPHPDPPPPTHDAEGRPIIAETGPALGRAYLESGQLERHPDRAIGVVQGPRYAETNLFLREGHFNEDPSQPLLAVWEADQQEAKKPPWMLGSKMRGYKLALRPVIEMPGLGEMHARNAKLDSAIQASLQRAGRDLAREGVDLDLMTEYVYVQQEDMYEREMGVAEEREVI